jgi:cytochrome c-type biogenesis protein CcmE
MRRRLRFVIGTGLIVAAIGYLIVTAVRNTAEYYLTVNEVDARQAELVGQMLRVAGRVKPGTISWDPQSLTLQFVIIPPPPVAAAGGDTMVKAVAVADSPQFHVICRGQPKPDMFAPNRDVIVEGQLEARNTIAARQVLTSCPSKYVPKQPK